MQRPMLYTPTLKRVNARRFVEKMDRELIAMAVTAMELGMADARAGRGSDRDRPSVMKRLNVPTSEYPPEALTRFHYLYYNGFDIAALQVAEETRRREECNRWNEALKTAQEVEAAPIVFEMIQEHRPDERAT
jgi:hypothetical protein